VSGLASADTVSRDLDPATCVAATRFIDSSHPAILATVDAIATGADDVTLAAELFSFVQNDIRYEFRAKMVPEQYVASYVLDHGQGFCVQKANVSWSFHHVGGGIVSGLTAAALASHASLVVVAEGVRHQRPHLCPAHRLARDGLLPVQVVYATNGSAE